MQQARQAPSRVPLVSTSRYKGLTHAGTLALSHITTAGFTRKSWEQHVAALTGEYVGFLRGGIACPCGAHLHQPLGDAAKRIVAAPGGPRITETIDLTLDDSEEDDPNKISR